MKRLFLLAILLSIAISQASHAAQFAFSSYFQYSKQSSAAGGGNVYSLIPGMRLSEDSWYAGIYLPVALNNGTSTSQNASDTAGGTMMGGGMSGLQPSLGGLFAALGARAVSENGSIPAVWVMTQAKAPLGHNGTGEWDLAAGVSVRKTFAPFFATADASYLKIGNPPGGSYQDGVLYGMGVGSVFAEGKFSLLAYYQGASAVRSGEAEQRQASAGFNFALSPSSFVTTTISKGLSDSSPAATASVGYTTYYSPE